MSNDKTKRILEILNGYDCSTQQIANIPAAKSPDQVRRKEVLGGVDRRSEYISGFPTHRSSVAGLWIPPSKSRASRLPAARSRSSCRGYIVNPRTNRELVYESSLEADLLYILLVHRDVDDIHDQPPAVSYVDAEGKRRKHTFDFRVHLHDGRKIAIAVKPERRVRSSGIERTLELIRQQVTDFADQYQLRTERSITVDRSYNAKLTFRARKMRDTTADEKILRMINKCQGARTIRALLEHASLNSHDFNAVVNLIGDGVLKHVSSGRITRDSFVRKGL